VQRLEEIRALQLEIADAKAKNIVYQEGLRKMEAQIKELLEAGKARKTHIEKFSRLQERLETFKTEIDKFCRNEFQ
jgi:hypothetical protein